MRFVVLVLLLLSSKIDTFLFSLNQNHVWIECGRSIIIQNHYWFLSEFLHLLQALQNNETIIHWQQMPFDHLYSILNSISIHCQQAYQVYQKTKKNQNRDQIPHWFKTPINN